MSILARERTPAALASEAGWVDPPTAVSAEPAAAGITKAWARGQKSAPVSAFGGIVHDLHIPQGDAGARVAVKIATHEQGAAGAHTATAAEVVAAVTALSLGIGIGIGERDVADGDVAG